MGYLVNVKIEGWLGEVFFLYDQGRLNVVVTVRGEDLNLLTKVWTQKNYVW